jgi:hypothetical protein
MGRQLNSKYFRVPNVQMLIVRDVYKGLSILTLIKSSAMIERKPIETIMIKKNETAFILMISVKAVV